MSFPALISHSGALNGSPAQGAVDVPSLQELINTGFSATYSSSKSGRPTIIGATDLSPFVLSLETITKVRVIVMRVRGGSLTVKLTSAKGTDQAMPFSSIFMLHAPNAGDEITAIKLVGTADLEYVIAGDVS